MSDTVKDVAIRRHLDPQRVITVNYTPSSRLFHVSIHPAVSGPDFPAPAWTLSEAKAGADRWLEAAGHDCAKAGCAVWTTPGGPIPN